MEGQFDQVTLDPDSKLIVQNVLKLLNQSLEWNNLRLPIFESPSMYKT